MRSVLFLCCSWVKLGFFYVCFYGGLCAYIASIAVLWRYFFVLTDYPALTGMQSTLQLNPGLSVRPNPDHLTTLIRFRAGTYVKRLWLMRANFYERERES